MYTFSVVCFFPVINNKVRSDARSIVRDKKKDLSSTPVAFEDKPEKCIKYTECVARYVIR